MEQKIEIFGFNHIADYLKAVLEGRSQENPNFSARVWARMMGLHSPSLLIAVLRKERRVSAELASCLKANLKLNEEEIRYFEALIVFSGPRAPLKEASILGYLQYLRVEISATPKT